MSLKARCVFDTSAAVSALLFDHSVPAQAFFAALEHGKILHSAATFAELSAVLGRKKFDRYVSQDDRERFLALILGAVELVEITEEIRVCRDPNDDKFLELAVCGAAACIVTGDDDLLVLHPYRQIPILKPAQFLEAIAGEEERGS